MSSYRREAEAAKAARAARRGRPCDSMPRATLVEHVAEFAPRHPGHVILTGLHTATLRELCATARDRRTWSGRLPGELVRGWHVYRILFADGSAYVGMTGQPVVERLGQHLSGNGSPRVWQRYRDGAAYRFDVLASVRTEHAAQNIEHAEIAKLAHPLNLAGPVNREQHLLFPSMLFPPASPVHSMPPIPPVVRLHLTRPDDGPPATFHFHVTDDDANVTAALLAVGEAPSPAVRMRLLHAPARKGAGPIRLGNSARRTSHHPSRQRTSAATRRSGGALDLA